VTPTPAHSALETLENWLWSRSSTLVEFGIVGMEPLNKLCLKNKTVSESRLETGAMSPENEATPRVPSLVGLLMRCAVAFRPT
jgi:hypothetical protein